MLKLVSGFNTVEGVATRYLKFDDVNELGLRFVCVVLVASLVFNSTVVVVVVVVEIEGKICVAFAKKINRIFRLVKLQQFIR